MPVPEKSEVTVLLERIREGDEKAAEKLMPLIYADLRSIAKNLMRRERSSHTLQPTALVHEAFLRLIGQENIDWQNKSHFLAIGAKAMRRILVDHARARSREKRGGNSVRISLEDSLTISSQRDEDLLAVDDALERLAEIDPRQAEIVEMRFFGGLTVAETAAVFNLSKRTIEAEWTIIRAWMRRELRSAESP